MTRMFETCAQPECTDEPVQGHDAIQGIQEAVDIDPETLTQEDSPNVMDLSQEESSIPELVSTSPNEDPIMYEMMQQVERAQTVLVAMSTGCPRNRYCSTVLEDIDAVLVETTMLLSTDLANVADVQTWKNSVKAVMEAFKGVKDVYDNIMNDETPKKALRRHPTDDQTDNDDASPTEA